MKSTAPKSDTSTKTRVPKVKRPRITFRFQLDIGRDNVEFFSQLQKYLAAQKSWKRYAMDGLRLIYDLKNGSTAVLLELFPNIREMLGVGQGSGGTDNSDLVNEIAELRRLILERDQLPPSTIAAQPALPASGNAKPLNAPTFAMPVFEDDFDDVKIEIRQDTSGDSSFNFVNALKHMQ